MNMRRDGDRGQLWVIPLSLVFVAGAVAIAYYGINYNTSKICPKLPKSNVVESCFQTGGVAKTMLVVGIPIMGVISFVIARRMDDKDSQRGVRKAQP